MVTTWLRAAVREKVVDSGIEEELVDEDDEVYDEDEVVEEPVAETESVEVKPGKQQG